VTAATALFGTAALQSAFGPAKAAAAGFAFRELEAGVDETHHVAEGYVADIVIRWGDPLAKDMKPFDARTLTAEERRQGLEAVRPRVDLRGSGYALAGLQARHAATPVRGGHPQEGRRQDRGRLNTLGAVAPTPS
jgi:Alkaline phosphatase PhoX